jgi:hypothetical protein
MGRALRYRECHVATTPVAELYGFTPLGAAPRRRSWCPGGIRTFMPEQHREFFEAQPYLLAATVDPDGNLRAFVLHGRHGFVRSSDPSTLEIKPILRLLLDSALVCSASTFRRAGAIASTARYVVLVTARLWWMCWKASATVLTITVRHVHSVVPETHPQKTFRGSRCRSTRNNCPVRHFFCRQQRRLKRRRHLAPRRPPLASLRYLGIPLRYRTSKATVTSTRWATC